MPPNNGMKRTNARARPDAFAAHPQRQVSGDSTTEQRLKILRRAPFLVVSALVATPTMADSGLPMLALLWPGFMLLLIPIIAVEAAWARRRLGLQWKPSLWLAGRANAISTLVGIPLAWVAMLCIELLVPYLLESSGVISPRPSENPSYVEHVLHTTVMAAWLPDGPAWYLPAATATLLVPSYFVSVFIEDRSARRSLPEALRPQAKAWSWQANLLTYVPLATGLILAAIWLGVSQK